MVSFFVSFSLTHNRNMNFIVPRVKKIDRATRIGSGRLNSGERFQPPVISIEQYGENDPPPYHNNNNNYYRVKTGREFCDNMIKQQQQQKKGDPNEYKVSFFNPVNRDHRRLLHEKSEENLPEWVNAGPKSRFDTIDLHGFHDDKSNGQETGSKVSENGGGENKENRDKAGKSFSFDEFLGSASNGLDNFIPVRDDFKGFRSNY